MKIWGLILLVGSGSTLGFLRAYEFRRRIADIMLLQNALQMLETEISYSLTPIPQAMGVLEEQLPKRIRLFFQCVRLGVEQKQLPIEQAWASGLEYLSHSTSCGTEALYALHSFGMSLGQGDVQIQQKQFQLLHRRLQHALDDAERVRNQQERVWQCMGICVSMAVALFLC